ncbi:MAG: ComEA family DNA-binding protein [Desulfuromonadales bacterium]
MPTSGSLIYLIMEGNAMKRCLLKMVCWSVLFLSGLAPVASIAAETPTVKTTIGTVHLNQATAEELQALPGVGPALSERIVLYRTEHGPFSSIDQLSEVKGLGQAKLAKFRNRLTLD